MSLLTRAQKVQVVVKAGYLDSETWRLAVRETVYDYRAKPGANTAESPQRGKFFDWSVRRMLKREARRSPAHPD